MCRPGQDGFDSNSAIHLQVLSNELYTPKVLVCPKDRSTTPAVDFGNLQFSNVSYRLRTGADLHPTNARAVLAVCPLDDNTLHFDGSVTAAR